MVYVVVQIRMAGSWRRSWWRSKCSGTVPFAMAFGRHTTTIELRAPYRRRVYECAVAEAAPVVKESASALDTGSRHPHRCHVRRPRSYSGTRSMKRNGCSQSAKHVRTAPFCTSGRHALATIELNCASPVRIADVRCGEGRIVSNSAIWFGRGVMAFVYCDRPRHVCTVRIKPTEILISSRARW